MTEEVKVYGDLGHYDVVIVGGGTAGCAAAVSAADCGMKTLIIEEAACLGGTSTGGLISMFMGFSDREDPERQKGFLGELLDNLKAEHATEGVNTVYLCGKKELAVPVVPYEAEALKRVLNRMMLAHHVEVMFHTRMVQVIKKESKITTLLVHNVNGIQTVDAEVIIDASFHGSAAFEAGCGYDVGGPTGIMQPGSLMYRMADVDRTAYDMVPQKEKEAIAQRGIEAGKLYVNNLLARPLPDGTMYSNMSRIQVNPFDISQWTKAEMDAREQVKDISSFFISHVPGFEHAVMCETGAFTGLRDSRRIRGKYILTGMDVLEGTEFEDAIAESSYPVDIHDANGTSSTIIKPRKGYFQVPFSCLVTEEIENLLIAGRCISADYEAHACIRVMITCMRTGEAAGYAAAEGVKRHMPVNQMDGRIVRKKIAER